MSEAEAWYRRAFAEDYLRIYRHRDQSEARLAVHNLLAHLALPAGTKCLDLGCGAGRHLSVLLDAGLDAVGIDLSEYLLEQAAADPDLRHRVTRADMRELPFPDDSFAFVFSFFTTFGYFAADDENLRVLREIARVLRPGGGFLMDYLNAPRVRATLVPEDHQRLGDLHVTQRRRIDEDLNRVEKTLIVRDADGERVYHERVKLYDLGDFQRLCATAGLEIRETLGDATGAPYREDAERLIIIGGHRAR